MGATDARSELRRLTSYAGWMVVVAFVGLGAWLAVESHTQADELDGRWSGRFSLLGNYYWETSTRVVAPELSVSLVSPRGRDLGFTYLVDTITSASQAAGVTEDVRFNEHRHDFTFGVGRELSINDIPFRWDVGAHFSREPDYTSASGNVSGSLSLNERLTTLRLSLGYLHDEVRQNFRGTPLPGNSGTMLHALNEDFDALSVSVGWDQVIRSWLVAELGYDLVYLNGFLANAYRRVMVQGAAVAEAHPGTRIRHTVTGRLKAHLAATGTTFQLRYRAYVDSWKIGAINPEVRIYQQLARDVTLRLRYRYYRQRRSFFFHDDDSEYTTDDPYVSNDPKMSAFHSHEAGVQLRLDFGFLGGTALDVLRDARLDLSVHYAWRTISFGDAVIAQVGLSVPF